MRKGTGQPCNSKRRVQAILRRCGRGQDTDLRILSDGEDGLRGVVGTWFGKKCQHRLDWFHIARRIARIEKEFLYLPYGDDFQERLAAHWANLNSMKWMLWNDGVEMAEFGMTRVRIGLFQHALAHQKQTVSGWKASPMPSVPLPQEYAPSLQYKHQCTMSPSPRLASPKGLII